MDRNILLTHQLPGKIIEIIQDSKDYCFLVTPYFQSWPLLDRELEKSASDNKKIVFIFRNQDNAIYDFSYLNDNYGFDLVFVDRLHTKLYMNDQEVLISSMNLYDSSKENNFEVGYYFSNWTISKDFKKQIIDDDILKSNPNIIKGRYFSELEEKERAAQFKSTSNQFGNRSYGFQANNGKCIRCGTPIKYNEFMPLCKNCFDTWSIFGNKEYRENFCHKCGKQDSWSNITFANPLCQECKSKSSTFQFNRF